MGSRMLGVWGPRVSGVWPMASGVLGEWVSRSVRDPQGVRGDQVWKVWEFRGPGSARGVRDLEAWDPGVFEYQG